MLPQQYCLRWKYHHSNLQTMFSQLLDRGCFCDVTLACEGQLIRAHRVVLCACSTFFDTVLTSYSNERDPIIIMKDVTFADVKCLIEFMYKGEINVEHSNLPSLLKTADDLKIKGLAEVTWRDDEDHGPIPTPATEFFSPRQAAKAYYGPDPANNRRTPTPPMHEEVPAAVPQHRLAPSPPVMPLKAFNYGPQTTPIALTTNEKRKMDDSSASIPAAPIEHFMAAKRKRGRPPLDDTYDVFNIRNMVHYTAMEQNFLEASRQFNEEQHKHLHFERPVTPHTKAAVAAYHEQIHQHHQEMLRQQQIQMQKHQQQQQQQQMKHHQQQKEIEKERDFEDKGKENQTKDLEWNKNTTNSNNNKLQVSDNKKGADMPGYQEAKPNDQTVTQKAEVKNEEEPQGRERHQSFSSPTKAARPVTPAATPKPAEKPAPPEESSAPIEKIIPKQEPEDKETTGTMDMPDQDQELDNQKETADQQNEERKELLDVPKPVEDIENAEKLNLKPGPSTSSSSSPNPHKSIPAPPPPPPSQPQPQSQSQPLRQNSHYNKYAPEGYLVNEHGILMAPDFIHAPTVAIPKASTSNHSASSSAGHLNLEHPDFLDVKMEDYDAADLRLTSEEITQWQDVIKMDDYLAKGRRPQFWEEPFTRRVLDAIKNKHLEMKKAARILGVSYGTLYGRYREVYGCLKHPYNGTSIRPSQLSLQSRLDFPLRAVAAGLPTPMDIGKIRPKDFSELWARPQL